MFVRPIHALIALATGLHRLSEDGQSLAEYGLVMALVVVISIVAVTAIGLAILGRLDLIGIALGGS